MHRNYMLNHNHEDTHGRRWLRFFTPPFQDNGCAQLHYNQDWNGLLFMQPAMQYYVIVAPQQCITCPHVNSWFQGGLCCHTNPSGQHVAIPQLQNLVVLPSWQDQVRLSSWPNQFLAGDNLVPSAQPECSTGALVQSPYHGLAAAPDTVLDDGKPVPAEDSFTLHPSRVTSGSDQRTTLIVRNIPTKMTQSRFRAFMSDELASKFDFLYVPYDWKTGGAFGYAFINLKEARDVLPFYERFHNFKPPQSNSTKIWKVAYARIQGRNELEAHFTSRTPNHKIAPDFCGATDTSAIATQPSETGLVNHISASEPRESRQTRRAKARFQQADFASLREPRQSRRERRARAQAQQQQPTESAQDAS